MSMPSYKSLVNGLYDIRVFCNLIKFKGGWKNFSDIHNQQQAFLTRPQSSNEDARDYRKRLVLIPRGHLKSTLTVLYVLWRLYRNPNIRFQICCDDKELAKKFLREMCFYLENTELQRQVWHNRPHIQGDLVPVIDAQGKRERISDRMLYYEQTAQKVVWNSEMIYLIRPTLMKEPSVAILSVEQTATGDHYDFLLLDDIINFSNSDTPKKARKIEEWIADLASVLDPSREMTVGQYRDPDSGELVVFKEMVGGEQVLNGTTYFKWDYYHKIIETKERRKFKVFRRNIYKNGKNNAEGYIYPERFNEEYEQEVREECLTYRRFASQYLLTIVADETKVLDTDALRYIDQGRMKVENGLVTVQVGDKEKLIKPLIVVDPAISLEKDADFTTITVGGVDEELNMIIIDFVKKRMLPNQTVDLIFDMSERWQCFHVVCEGGVGFQDALYHSVRNAMREKNRILRVTRYVPQGNKKQNIALVMEPIIANSKLYLPYFVKKLIEDELELFPSEGVEDDGLDGFHVLAKFAFPANHANTKLRNNSTRHVIINRRFGGCR